MRAKVQGFPENILAIGDVARATGISVYKLRIWERRYQFPEPLKLPSGHRRYTEHSIEHLKLVKIALDTGTRISKLVRMSFHDLVHLVKTSNHQKSIDDLEFYRIVAKLKDWDEKALLKVFENEWNKDGPMNFINNCAAKLVVRVGQAWEQGSISAAEEHFVSEALGKFLSQKWMNTNSTLSGKSVILTTLENESHSFGLHFCAITANQAKVKVINLGPSLPVEDISSAITKGYSSAVCISISSNYPPTEALAKLKRLRKMLPSNIHIVTGGQGSPSNLDGIISIKNFREFYDWLLDAI